MTYVQCHSLTPPIDGHNRPHCVRSDFQNSKISNIRPNLEHFGAFERVGGPGRRSRLLPRYPRGVWDGPHPGGAGTPRDHARKLDTDPVGVAQEFR